jgi:hypothetical protein
MNLDRINTRTTYAMWHEERLWNVGVLQSVRLFNLLLVRITPLSSKHSSLSYAGYNQHTLPETVELHE